MIKNSQAHSEKCIGVQIETAVSVLLVSWHGLARVNLANLRGERSRPELNCQRFAAATRHPLEVTVVANDPSYQGTNDSISRHDSVDSHAVPAAATARPDGSGTNRASTASSSSRSNGLARTSAAPPAMRLSRKRAVTVAAVQMMTG